jgi:ubiquinone/menaquinone biosynthesis C-methylase UbiE
MSKLRTGRQRFYNVFSHFYDFFITMHSGSNRDETRRYLVNSSTIHNTKDGRVLDICCGTGSVILAFAEKYADILAIGYDFSPGMLHKTKEKDVAGKVTLVNGDAACLSFVDDCFDVVCCSHALYELKGETRTAALQEMKRVVKPQGQVLMMEHEVPEKPVVKMMFYIRMMMMGPTDSNEFVKQGLLPFTKIFSDVTLSHTPSGKSKLIICRKKI